MYDSKGEKSNIIEEDVSSMVIIKIVEDTAFINSDDEDELRGSDNDT